MKMPEFIMVKPRRLEEGETIGVVAPAWSFEPESFRKGVEKLRQLGFKVKYDRAIFNEYWSMAGFDRERADQINRMFADKQVRAIFCATAGYGSMRTIPYLNASLIRRNPKIFVGYSDITMLLSYLYHTAHMPVFHGPVIADEIHERMNSITLDYLLSAITQTKPLGELKFPRLRSIKPGRACGALVGGNMSSVVNAIGTPYEIDTIGKVLFLEDIGEDLEVIDSYLMQLKMAKKFKFVKAIVFGRMLGCYDDSGNKYSVEDILVDILHDVNCPIIYGFPSGHRTANDIDITLPLGVAVTVDANDPKLIIKESGVR